MKRSPIRDFYNRIIGWIETDELTGNQVARDFYNRILGTYEAKLDVTRDFYNRIVAKGNVLSGLILEEENKKHIVDINKRSQG